MPELPEVEVLVRHLAPALRGRTIRNVQVHREKVIRPTSEAELTTALKDRKIKGVTRRGKYLQFELAPLGRSRPPVTIVGHLGMTGRMFLQPANAPLPKHAAVSLDLGSSRFVFQDTRYFGRFNLDTATLSKLGPEPLGDAFTVDAFAASLARSTQPIKVKLLDQTVVAGVGNIYASEALFRAGVSPLLPAKSLKPAQVTRLRDTVREVLTEAIECGSTIPLDFAAGKGGMFYYGAATESESPFHQERLLVYDRKHQPCVNCGTAISHCVQAARSTYFCPRCQPKRPGPVKGGIPTPVQTAAASHSSK